MWLGTAAAAVPRIIGGGPLIGRRQAQILARRELGKVSIWARILHDIEKLFNTSANAVPGGWFGLVVFGVIIAVLIIAILTWVRPSAGRGIRARPLLGGKGRTALDYRRSATSFAEAGDYSQAIVEAVRAIAAELEERGILPPRLGRTADEFAVEAGGELPELATDLRAVTRLFDDIRYGDRAGTQAGYELVGRVDSRVRTAPATTTDGNRAAAADLLVPR
jgi:hypothetical protein